MVKRILILNGPNLNMLGKREPEIYGKETLDDIKQKCEIRAKELGATLEFKQSNSEGELVDIIQQAKDKIDVLIINAGAYTHTSVAIRDAILSASLTSIELHLSNIFAREEFRHHSFISDISKGIISGFGSYGYLMALDAAVNL